MVKREPLFKKPQVKRIEENKPKPPLKNYLVVAWKEYRDKLMEIMHGELMKLDPVSCDFVRFVKKERANIVRLEVSTDNFVIVDGVKLFGLVSSAYNYLGLSKTDKPDHTSKLPNGTQIMYFGEHVVHIIPRDKVTGCPKTCRMYDPDDTSSQFTSCKFGLKCGTAACNVSSRYTLRNFIIESGEAPYLYLQHGKQQRYTPLKKIVAQKSTGLCGNCGTLIRNRIGHCGECTAVYCQPLFNSDIVKQNKIKLLYNGKHNCFTINRWFNKKRTTFKFPMSSFINIPIDKQLSFTKTRIFGKDKQAR